jgi:HPt (histidine-containing phosphotransfer) domain-containing protein
MPTGFDDIVPGYLADRRKEVAEMIALLAASDFERVSVLSHNLKGTARGYGFPDLVEVGASLQRSADEMDRESLHTQMAGLADYLERVQLIAKG